MASQTETSKSTLEAYIHNAKERGDTSVGRKEVLAHAFLSALQHHWPSKAEASFRRLLIDSVAIREAEPSRWMTQRKIAIRKLSEFLG
jgi:hypothetical protein